MGDRRRSRRLVRVVRTLADHPESSIPGACATWADAKATYRFFSNEDVDPQAILSAHRASTMRRAEAYPVVLALQDTTTFNFTKRPATMGLGPIGSTPNAFGFLTHSCLAVGPDGVPLGLLGQFSWVRPGAPARRSEAERIRTPIEHKESRRWLDMLGESMQGLPSGTRLVAVADREADIFDFYQHALALGQDVLVRSCSDRRVDEREASLWDQAEKAPVACVLEVDVARHGGRKARRAVLEVRYATVTVCPPRHRRRRKVAVEAPVPLTVVLAREVDAPRGVEPACWRLLTSLSVGSGEDAARCVRWYSLRWRVERFHFVLKSGCRVEDLQLEERERVERALAAYTVVAWRLVALTYAARANPGASCLPWLSDREWATAHALVHGTKPSRDPPTLNEAVRLVARLGGFLARKGDGEPGVKVLWRGLVQLHTVLAGLDLMEEAGMITRSG